MGRRDGWLRCGGAQQNELRIGKFDGHGVHPSRLRLGPTIQAPHRREPRIGAIAGAKGLTGQRLRAAGISIHTLLFEPECQSFLRCRDVIADFAEPRSGDWRASMQRMLTDPDLHVTARPSVYEVALELHPGDIPA